jgi:6-pyruvoyltetrahydropterin/6-carboxytetrahydropterin synthase
MKLTATKEFTFDCAHMLTGHQGLCKNLHGHTYRLEIEVQYFGSGGQIPDGPSEGMVVDFKDLKEIVNRRIVSKMDHAFIFHNAPGKPSVEMQIASLLQGNGLKCYVMEDRPTAENMSKHIFAALSHEFKSSGVVLKRVRVYETATSYADFQA